MSLTVLRRWNTCAIGGVDQYIRGNDSSLRVLLFLHGGRGMPAMYLAHAFQRELEKEFVVVQWDRRPKPFPRFSTRTTSARRDDGDFLAGFMHRAKAKSSHGLNDFVF